MLVLSEFTQKIINMKVKRVNQVHPPLPKKVRVDKNGNDRRKVWLKSGTSTMLLCKGLTLPGTEVLIKSIKDKCAQLGTKVEGTLLVTH